MKKVLKFILWGLLVIVGIGGVGVLATAISGGFNPEKIYINSLTINGVKEYATISHNDESYTGRVDFLPADANQLTLTAKVMTGSDVIEEMPTVTAGQNFTLKFKKEDGVVKGGELEIKFVDSSNNAFATLKVLVDVKLTSDHVKVESNGASIGNNVAQYSGTLSTRVSLATTQANTIKITTDNANMLNSYKGSWSESDANSIMTASRMKKMFYFNTDTVAVRITDLEIKNEGNSRYYLFSYLSNSTTSVNEPALLSVYIYRTFYLEEILPEQLAKNIVEAITKTRYNDSLLNYDQINAFVNTYMYGSCSAKQKEALDELIDLKTGLVAFGVNQATDRTEKGLKAILDYAFMHFDVEINVRNIVVKTITVPAESNYMVLQDTSYDVTSLRESGVTLNIDSETIDESVLTNNLRKVDIIPVKKITLADDQTIDSYFEKDEGESIRGKDYYLIDSAYYEPLAPDNDYITVTKSMEDGVASWKLNTVLNSASGYYLLYKYRNNDVSNMVIYDLDNATGGVTYSGTFYVDSEGVWYQWSNDNKWEEYTASADFMAYVNSNNAIGVNKTSYRYSQAYDTLWQKYEGNAWKNFTDSKYMLGGLFNDVVKLSPVKIEFTPTSITSTNSDEQFVLNKNIRIYKNVIDGSETKRVLVDGLNYVTKEIKVNGTNPYVSLSATDGNGTPEYTTIKWLVRKDDNIITNKNNEIYYRFLPTFVRSVNGTGGSSVRYEPRTYKLKDTSDNDIKVGDDGSATEFMELGTNDFTLTALNITENTPVRLYPVVIQTKDKNGTPYITKDGSDDDVYKAVTYDVAGIALYTDNYIENLYAYVKDNAYVIGEKNTPEKKEATELTHLTNNPDCLAGISALGTTIYISSLQLALDENGKVIPSANNGVEITRKQVVCYETDNNGKLVLVGDDKYQGEIVIESAVYSILNEDRALRNYKDTITDSWYRISDMPSGIGWSISSINLGDGTVGTISEPATGAGATQTTTEQYYYLTFTFKKGSEADTGSGFMQIFANGGSTYNKAYALVGGADENDNGISIRVYYISEQQTS